LPEELALSLDRGEAVGLPEVVQAGATSPKTLTWRNFCFWLH